MSDAQRREHRLDIARHAVRLFRDDGVAATTGRDIATAAGVSERTLWRWFRAKEACVDRGTINTLVGAIAGGKDRTCIANLVSSVCLAYAVG